MAKIQVTSDGYEKLKKELKYLEGVKRPEVAVKIKDARDKGNILENISYDNALEEQGLVESRIGEINEALNKAEVVKNLPTDIVVIGSTVEVEVNSTKDVFKVVSSMEADPLKRYISSESPVGSALLDKKVGDMVEIKTPVIQVNYKILSIK